MKTVIEAGHYYSSNGPSALSLSGWEIGKQYALGKDATSVLFVDDYHDSQLYLEPGDYFLPPMESAAAAAQLAGEADFVFYEAELAASAGQKAEQLLDDGLAKLKKGIVSAGGIRLGCLRWA